MALLREFFLPPACVFLAYTLVPVVTCTKRHFWLSYPLSTSSGGCSEGGASTKPGNYAAIGVGARELQGFGIH